MSPTVKTTNELTNDIMQYAPLALATISSVEAAAAAMPGATKSQIAVNTVMAAASAGATSTQPSVAAVSGLVELLVGILNFSGIFTHTPKAPAVPGALSGLTPGVNPAPTTA